MAMNVRGEAMLFVRSTVPDQSNPLHEHVGGTGDGTSRLAGGIIDGQG